MEAKANDSHYTPANTITLGTAKHAAFTDILRSIGYDAYDHNNNLVSVYGINACPENIGKLQRIRNAVERNAK
jgi:hypothetical protein